VPSLSERRQDLPLLIRHFLDKYASQYGKKTLTTTRRAEIVLSNYGWPGNIREIEHVIGRCSLVCDGNIVDVRDLPEWIMPENETSQQETVTSQQETVTSQQETVTSQQETVTSQQETVTSQLDDLMISLVEIDERHARRVLAALGGNMTKAAAVLGIGRTTLYRLLRRVNKPDAPESVIGWTN
jgi:DNA-binding NtrC family response regulator